MSDNFEMNSANIPFYSHLGKAVSYKLVKVIVSDHIWLPSRLVLYNGELPIGFLVPFLSFVSTVVLKL